MFRQRPRLNLLLLLSLILMGSVNAQSNLADWSCYKEIKIDGPSKYKSFWLDREVYQKAAPDLKDLRVVNKKGQTVPYFIQSGYPETQAVANTFSSKLIKRFQKKNNTYFDFQVIPQDKKVDIIGNKLVFSMPTVNFLKNILLYGSYDGTAWEYLGEDQLYQVDSLTKNYLSLNQSEKYSYYRLVVLKNLEYLELSECQLISDQSIVNWQEYQKQINLKYQVSTQESNSIIKLKNPYHLRLKRIFLQSEGNFKRQFEVGAETKLECETDWIYQLRFQDLNISNNSINLNTPTAMEQVTIKIFNFDNRPLPIKSITVDYYIDKVIFEDDGQAPYRVYFGNEKANQPYYDLELYKDHIQKEKQDLGILKKLVQIREFTLPRKSQLNLGYLFNGIIVLISLLLVFFIIRQLGANKP